MPLQSACASSKEERVLPLLYPETRARHSHSKRIDTIPQHYAEMSGEELDRRIAKARASLGERLVILGHHYQRDEIIKAVAGGGEQLGQGGDRVHGRRAEHHFLVEHRRLGHPRPRRPPG